MSTEPLNDEWVGEGDARPDDVARRLIAFATLPGGAAPIGPAPRWRDWMNATDDRWANRCLPLLVANESGWTIHNPAAFTAVWTGEDGSSSVTIEFDGDQPMQTLVESVFGYGVITWRVPFLFRTPPGWNLLARGPANWPKDGICALEGLVETDWSPMTFTMNWKLTRAGQPVRFEVDEPFCMVVPQRRGELESFLPEVRPLESNPELLADNQWYARRRHDLSVRKFLGQYSKDFEDSRYEWQRDYFKGVRPDGSFAAEHQTQRRLPPFMESGEETA
jgi:hypothetical protein